MSELNSAYRFVLAITAEYRDELILGGLGLTVLLLIWGVRKVVLSGRADKWLTGVSVVLGFAWSAEAMWEIATKKMHLSAYFALPAFVVFESMLAVAMMRAERSQRLYGHPGKFGRATWQIATTMAVVAMLSGDSLVEHVLRFVVPLLVAKQWWDGLTGDGTVRSPDAITWTLTPRGILIKLGLARAGKYDLTTVDRQRQILALAKAAHGYHSTRLAPRRAFCGIRVRQLSMRADDEMLAAARGHVERVWRSIDSTRPRTEEELAAITAAQQEAKAALAKADAALRAKQDAVTWANENAERLGSEMRQVRDELAEEQRLRRAAEDEAREQAAVAVATSQRADLLQWRPAERGAGGTSRPRERSGSSAGEATSIQTDRAQWIESKIESEGLPQSEVGWADLTKAVSAHFKVSERTARRDVTPFKQRELLPTG